MAIKVHDFQFLSLLSENYDQEVQLTHPTVLLLLNSPQLSLPWIERLWSKCDLILCADGAANRLFRMTTMSSNPELWKYYE